MLQLDCVRAYYALTCVLESGSKALAELLRAQLPPRSGFLLRLTKACGWEEGEERSVVLSS